MRGVKSAAVAGSSHEPRRGRRGAAPGACPWQVAAGRDALLLVACSVAALVVPAGARAGVLWSAPADISSAAVDVDAPRIAVDVAGDGVAVWYQSIGVRDVIESAARSAVGGWSGPVQAASGSDAYGPEVALDGRGDATAVWYEFDGNEDVVDAATRTAGGTWSAPQQLSVPSVLGGGADEPQLAVDANGDAVAVWYQFDGINYVIEAARLPAGGTWSAPQQLSGPGGDAYGPHVAIDAHGIATAIWYRYSGGVPPGVVQAATGSAGGGWTPPQALSSAAQDSSEPQVASDPSGDVIAVWTSFNGSADVIEAASLPAGGGWSAVSQVSSGGNADAPQVAINGQGTATAVWDSSDGVNSLVQAATRQAGGGWSAPAAISLAGQDAGDPQVGADASGDVAAVWYRFNGLADVIETATRPAGSGWSASQQLSGGDAYQPQIALTAPGQATAVWYLTNGASAVIQASSTTTAGSGGAGGGGTGGGGTGGGAGGLGAGSKDAPVITSLHLHPTTFRPARSTTGRSTTGASRSTGTRVSFRDSTAATTTFTVLALRFSRCTPARQRRRECVVRGRRVGSFMHRDRVGSNRFHFSGRLGRRTLAPGRYWLVASPRDSMGRTGAARTVDFRIIH